VTNSEGITNTSEIRKPDLRLSSLIGGNE